MPEAFIPLSPLRRPFYAEAVSPLGYLEAATHPRDHAGEFAPELRRLAAPEWRLPESMVGTAPDPCQTLGGMNLLVETGNSI